MRKAIVSLSLAALFILASCRSLTHQKAPSSGYDVFLLVGQSNMVGVGRGPDNAADAAVSPRVWQWDPASHAIVEARDPLYQNEPMPHAVGLGMTFGKAYLSGIPANRNVLLIGAAANNTTFVSGRWRAPNGDLARTAVERVNAAIAAAGPRTRFAGILWLQGEGDISEGAGDGYEKDLCNLISYFRSNIHGASRKTPFVVGELSHQWLAYNLRSVLLTTAQNTIMNVFHTLPEKMPYTAWVSSANLTGDDENGIIHFSALSQRQLGRRYAEKLLEVVNNLPQSKALSQTANVEKMNWLKRSFRPESSAPLPISGQADARYPGRLDTTPLPNETVLPLLLDALMFVPSASPDDALIGRDSAWNSSIPAPPIAPIYSNHPVRLDNF